MSSKLLDKITITIALMLLFSACLYPIKDADAFVARSYQDGDRVRFELDFDYTNPMQSVIVDLGYDTTWLDISTYDFRSEAHGTEGFELTSLYGGLLTGVNQMFFLEYNTWDALSPYYGIYNVAGSDLFTTTAGAVIGLDQWGELGTRQTFSFHTPREAPVSTPEPSSLLLLGCGLLGLWALGKTLRARS